MKILKTFKLRFKADFIPTIVVMFSFSILIGSWLWIDSHTVWLIINILLFLPRVMSTTFVHNHSHLPTFRSNFANFGLETILYFLSGMMSSKFKLHHNLGHHLYYLEPNKDPSTWLFKNGKIMPRWFYTLRYYMTHTLFSILIGFKHKKLLREYIIQQIWLFVIIVIMFVFKPVPTLYLIFIPMTIMWLLFIMVTYDDHVGLDSKSPLEASFTKTNKYINTILLNNGYHTAHHLKPGMHWSELPSYHSTIESDIPDISAHTSLNKFSLFLHNMSKT